MENKEQILKHASTMHPNQRATLIKILGTTHDINALAVLTDPDLHELWIRDCEYPNPYQIIKYDRA